MRRVEKKILPGFFEIVASGKKNFEARIADFKIKEGDILVLREWDPKTRNYTGRALEKKVTYVLKTKKVKFWKKEDLNKYGLYIISLK